jgi:hypothetical protein
MPHSASGSAARWLLPLAVPPDYTRPWWMLMRSVGLRILVASLAFSLIAFGTGPQVDAQSPPVRLTGAHLTRLGSFNVPTGIRSGGLANAGFEYGGSAISFNAGNNSLFIVGHVWDQFVGEISIPPVGGTATLLQGLTDATEGRLPSINPTDPNSKRIGGTLRWGNNLVVSAYSYYDGMATQVLSHFLVSPNLSTTGDVIGPLRVGELNAGLYSGYMGVIPSAWRVKLGGPALTGNSSLAIISRSSYGPAAFAFDPGNMSSTGARPLVYYPQDHQTLGAWNAAGPYWGGTDRITGIALPEGSSSLLFFGRHGSTFCYGPGTSDQSKEGQPTGVPGEVYCYDPTDSSKGVHGYPYAAQVWAYDADELYAVRRGTKQPWDVKPYAMWSLPGMSPTVDISGAAYDPTTQRLYLSEKLATSEVLPVIHVFSISLDATVTTQPKAPSNLRVVP